MKIEHSVCRRLAFRAWGLRITGRHSAPPRARRPRWFFAAVLVLGGYLLFVHGCHADEDTELLVKKKTPPVVAGGVL